MIQKAMIKLISRIVKRSKRLHFIGNDYAYSITMQKTMFPFFLICVILFINSCIPPDSALHNAVYANKENKALKLLLKHPEIINYKGFHGATALHHVGTADMVELLIKRGANVNARDDEGLTPLHTYFLSKFSGRYPYSAPEDDVVKALIIHGADVNAKSNDGSTPLHWAASFWGPKETIKHLIDGGADINAKNSAGFTPLHKAVYMFHKEGARLLISRGADVNACDTVALTPLHIIAYHTVCAFTSEPSSDESEKGFTYPRPTDIDIKGIVRLLVTNGANLYARNNLYFTPYETALYCYNGEVKAVLKALQDSLEKVIWPTVIKEDTFEKYLEFLSMFPSGTYYKIASNKALPQIAGCTLAVNIEIKNIIEKIDELTKAPPRSVQSIKNQVRHTIESVFNNAGYTINDSNDKYKIDVIYNEYIKKDDSFKSDEKMILISPEYRPYATIIFNMSRKKETKFETVYNLVLHNLNLVGIKVPLDNSIMDNGASIAERLNEKCFLFKYNVKDKKNVVAKNKLRSIDGEVDKKKLDSSKIASGIWKGNGNSDFYSSSTDGSITFIISEDGNTITELFMVLPCTHSKIARLKFNDIPIVDGCFVIQKEDEIYFKGRFSSSTTASGVAAIEGGMESEYTVTSPIYSGPTRYSVDRYVKECGMNWSAVHLIQ